MTLDTTISILRSFWGLWVMLFFCGIVLWAYWPKSKAKMEAWGDIPLRDDHDDHDDKTH